MLTFSPAPPSSDALSSVASTIETVSECAPRHVVAVLGMHRSGTSLCMRMLHDLGVEVSDDLIPGDASNAGGYFESRRILQLNEGILQSLHANWHTVFSLALPERWWDAPALIPWKAQLESLLRRARESGKAPWGMKDPRLCPLLPLYEEAFAQCGIQPSYVVCIRDPRAVALSLNRRDHLPQMLSELLWLDYVVPIFRLASPRIRAVVHYEDWCVKGTTQISQLVRSLRLESKEEPEGAILARAYSPALDHGKMERYALASTESIYRNIRAGDYTAALAEYDEVRRSVKFGLRSDLRCREVCRVTPGDYRVNACQVFWRLAGQSHFCEEASHRQHTHLEPQPRRIHLSIPATGEPIERIRVDPFNTPGYACLVSLKLVSSEALTLWEWDRKSESLRQWESHSMNVLEAEAGGVNIHSPTDDPGILLPSGPYLAELSRAGGTLELEVAWLGSTRSIPANESAELRSDSGIRAAAEA